MMMVGEGLQPAERSLAESACREGWLQNQQGSCRPVCPAQAHSWVPPLQSQPSQGLGCWETGKDKDRYLVLEQRPGLGVPA